MDSLFKHIREATGLTTQEYCKNYLDSNFQAFRNRIKGDALRPNEMLLICLHTGKSPEVLFGKSAFEVFFLKGKDKTATHIKNLMKTNASEKINMILNDPNGLEIAVPNLDVVSKPRKQRENKKEEQPIEQSPEKKEVVNLKTHPKQEIVKADDFDFVETNLFK